MTSVVQHHRTARHLRDHPLPLGLPKGEKLFGRRDGNYEHSSNGGWTEKVTLAKSDQHSCISEWCVSATTSVSPDTSTSYMLQFVGVSYPGHKDVLLNTKVARK